MFIKRDLKEKLLYMASKFPVITVTGTRQCGKSTLLRSTFPTYKYVTLEDLDMRQLAKDDPRGFLINFGAQTIIDEAQYVPQLFSYIQTIVDSKNEVGMYILSGSQNFLLMESITQSLAGRTAILKLATFSVAELKNADKIIDLNTLLFTGGYPRIYDKEIHPTDFYPSYIQTYIERDVRMLRSITDLGLFLRFVKLCAARVGQLLNVASLANEADISIPTANSWISILESSYVIYLLKPYHSNFNKRLVKSPKLYFYDTGLVSSLLGLTSQEQLSTHYLRGELFENMVITECIKQHFSVGREPNIYFWRDSNHNEVDLLIENGDGLQAIEIKSSATLNTKFFKVLHHFQTFSNTPTEKLSVIYGGDIDFITEIGTFKSWKNIRFLE